MRRADVTLLSALFLVLVNATTALENTTIEPASDNGTTTTISLRNYQENDVFKLRLNLAPSRVVTLSIEDVPSYIWFIVLQVHTFQYNATLSYDKTLLNKASNRSLFGSNIGLYLNTHNITVPMQMYLKHDNVRNLDALLVVVPYGREAPIPGGCNMEFEIEVAPYQKLRATNEMIIVDTQPASLLSANHRFCCEKNPVRYKMYRSYLPRWDFSPETYFAAIENMLTAQDIVWNGDEIPFALTTPPMRHVYSAYAGTGSVYAVIATYENYSSAYVPTFTYACSPLLYPESCHIFLNDTFSKVICALVLFIGFLSIIRGHRYVSVDRLLPSCAMGGLFGYALAVEDSEYRVAMNVAIAMAFAILAACITVYLRRRMDEKPLYMLLCNLPLGILCACITYLYAPAGMFYILENDYLFWPTFMSFAFAIATLLLLTINVAEVIIRAIFGSFFLIIAFDYYIGTNLKYIIITFVRRLTTPGFHSAFVYPPQQSSDIVIITIWIVLIMVRFSVLNCTGKSSASEERQALLGVNGMQTRRQRR